MGGADARRIIITLEGRRKQKNVVKVCINSVSANWKDRALLPPCFPSTAKKESAVVTPAQGSAGKVLCTPATADIASATEDEDEDENGEESEPDGAARDAADAVLALREHAHQGYTAGEEGREEKRDWWPDN